jgi:zinc protease
MRSFRPILLGGAAAAVLLASAFQAQAQVTASVAAAPAAQERLAPLPDVNIPYTRFVLPNGLTLIVHEDHKAPIVAVNIWYHVGSKNEPTGRSGFAHLFEHLMFNGSENFNNDFFKATELLGATDQNGTTNTDRTNYFQNVPTSALDSHPVAGERPDGPPARRDRPGPLDEQRGVVQNEKRQGENQPYGRVWDFDHQRHLSGRTTPMATASSARWTTWTPPAWRTCRPGSAPGTARPTRRSSWPATSPRKRPAPRSSSTSATSRPDRRSAIPLQMVARMVGAQRRGDVQDRVGQPRLYKVWNVPAKPVRGGGPTIWACWGEVLSSGRNSRLYKRLVFDDQVATGVSAGVAGTARSAASSWSP